MQHIVLNIKNRQKSRSFVDFIKQLGFVKIESSESVKSSEQTIAKDIHQAFSELKNRKTSPWKSKKVTIKNA